MIHFRLTPEEQKINKKLWLNEEYGRIIYADHYIATRFPRLMSKKKYTFSRAKWYIAEFNVTCYFEVDKWCEKQFGKHDNRPNAWSRWWHRYESSIHFRDEKDYILFVLRWGG